MKKLLSILFIIMLIITFIQIRNVYALYKDQLSDDSYSTEIGDWYIKINNTDIVTEDGQTVNFDMSTADLYFETNNNQISAETARIAPDMTAGMSFIIDPKNDKGETTDVAIKYEIFIGDITSYTTYKYKVNESTGKTEDLTSTIVDITDPTVSNQKLPLTFEIIAVKDTFAKGFDEYNLPIEEDTVSFKKNGTKYDEKVKGIVATGVIPLSTIKSGNVDRVTVYFQWKVENENLRDKYEKIYEDMLKANSGFNKETGYTHFVRLNAPITVKVTQYLGEDI